MKLEITERDKVLLMLVSVLLITVSYLFLGILPLHRANRDMREQLASAEAEMEAKEKKIAGLAEVSSVHDELKEDLAQVQDGLYPMMESREIDKILTELALEHGLSVRKMEIQIPKEASDLPPFGEVKEEKAADDLKAADSVFLASVLMEVTGTRKDEDRLLDEIAQSMPGIRTLSMRRIALKNRSPEKGEDGEDILELKLEISMCRKSLE